MISGENEHVKTMWAGSRTCGEVNFRGCGREVIATAAHPGEVEVQSDEKVLHCTI